ncbi:MAG: hypothetical protein ACUVUR_08255 [bacterium]
MPWFGYIHPILAILTLVYGITIGQTTLSRMGQWDFPMRRVRVRTFIYFLLTVVNLGLGILINTILARRGGEVKLIIHLPLAIATSVLALLSTLVTFSKGKPGELAPMMRWHPVLVVASLALIMTMGFTALLKFLKL